MEKRRKMALRTTVATLAAAAMALAAFFGASSLPPRPASGPHRAIELAEIPEAKDEPAESGEQGIPGNEAPRIEEAPQPAPPAETESQEQAPQPAAVTAPQPEEQPPAPEVPETGREEWRSDYFKLDTGEEIPVSATLSLMVDGRAVLDLGGTAFNGRWEMEPADQRTTAAARGRAYSHFIFVDVENPDAPGSGKWGGPGQVLKMRLGETPQEDAPSKAQGYVSGDLVAFPSDKVDESTYDIECSFTKTR